MSNSTKMIHDMFPGCDDLMDVNEVARVLHVGRHKVYRLIATGELMAIRPGKAYLVPRVALAAYVVMQLEQSD